jgi:hypothetical protein
VVSCVGWRPVRRTIRSGSAKRSQSSSKLFRWLRRTGRPCPAQLQSQLAAGVSVDSQEILGNWRSQVRPSDLARLRALDISLEGICIGNELREGGDEPDKKRFSARLSFALANVLHTYRDYLEEWGWHTPLTYAMESIVCEEEGNFHEWLWPLIDACDVVGMNLYPMGNAAWFTFQAFEESRKFLQDTRLRHDRLAQFEVMLRHILQQLATVGKPLILTESGFPSAIGYHLESERRVVPEHNRDGFFQAMVEFLTLDKN